MMAGNIEKGSFEEAKLIIKKMYKQLEISSRYILNKKTKQLVIFVILGVVVFALAGALDLLNAGTITIDIALVSVSIGDAVSSIVTYREDVKKAQQYQQEDYLNELGLHKVNAEIFRLKKLNEGKILYDEYGRKYPAFIDNDKEYRII